jgi:hypothetical protein
MRFKEFLLKENNYDISVKVRDILTSLQTIYEDFGVMSRKDVDNYLKNIVNTMRPLLKSKSDIVYSKTIQKIATNLMKYLDPDVPNINIDPKVLIYSCVEELKNLLAGKKSINKKEEKEPPAKEKTINQELKDSSANLKQTIPPNPGMETGVDNDKSPPMGGDGTRTLNVV